jgi:Flp pilus assembly protein TadD
VIWFAVHREPAGVLLAPTPTPTPTGEDGAKAALVRGNGALSVDDYDQAISDYTEAIRLKPDDSDSYNGRGNAYKGQGKLDKAKADFAKGAELQKVGH